jgi:RNA polymerase sigma-70 factor (ECF subfamily)
VCARTLSISVANSYKRVSRAQAFLRLYVLEQSDEDGRSLEADDE